VRSIFKIFRILILVSLAASGVHYLINNKSYTFKAAEIKRLGEKYAGQHPNQCLSKITNDLRRSYGAHVLSSASTRWISISPGGMKTKIYFLHASLTEFLAVVGYPLATHGHYGLHWMNESCSVLTGNLQQAKDDPATLLRQDFGPGDHVRFGMFEGSFLATGDDTWLLCYGRGFLPTSLPYLTVSSLVTNVDPLSIGHMYYILIKSVVYQTALSLEEAFDFYKRKFIS